MELNPPYGETGKLKIIRDCFISSLSFKNLTLCNSPSICLLRGWKDHPNLSLFFCSPAIHIPSTQGPGEKKYQQTQNRKTPRKAKICGCRFPEMLYFNFFFYNEEPFVSCLNFLGLCLSNVLNYIEATASFLSFK